MLTLKEIENVSFRKSGLGGYKTDDVDTFVDGVIEKVRDLELQNKEMAERVNSLNQEIQTYKEREESVQNAIITAEMASRKVTEEAQEKADLLEKESREKSETMLAEAEEKSKKLLAEAQEKADHINEEINQKADKMMNDALKESSGKIEENNQMIEQQKQMIIQLKEESAKFKESLLEQYKNHIKLIGSLPKSNDAARSRKELDEKYPESVPNQPIEIETVSIEEVSEEVIEETEVKPMTFEDIAEKEEPKETKFDMLSIDDIDSEPVSFGKKKDKKK